MPGDAPRTAGAVRATPPGPAQRGGAAEPTGREQCRRHDDPYYNPRVAPIWLPALIAACMAQPPQLASEVGRRSLPWLPPDLARQVVKHSRDFNRGVAAAAAWPPSYHRPGGPRGVTTTIPEQCRRLVAALRNREPFSEVVAGLGVLAHLTLDLGSPFLDRSVGDAHARAFSSYVQSAAPRIPFVFYGQARPLIVGPDSGIGLLVDERRDVASSLWPAVRDDLDRVGGPTLWPRLDDRSTSFGAASVVLNHAATDFANLASWVWYHGGGLVPDIPAPRSVFLVWRGEPKPRETASPHLGFRQAPR